MVEKAKRKILITGSSGMLGEDLSFQFTSCYDVAGIDIRPSKNKNILYYNCDINDEDNLAGIFNTVAPQLVIHAAAYTDVDGCEQNSEKAELINVMGTKNIVNLCRRNKTKLVFISTDYVFDGNKDIAYNEDDRPNPLNIYGRSKLAAESIIRSELVEFLIVRTSWLFGSCGRNFVDAIINKSNQQSELHVVDDQVGCPTYTLSLAEAISKLSSIIFNNQTSVDKYGIYHVTNSNSCSWYEFAAKIIEFKNINCKIIPVGSSFINRPAKRPRRSILANRRYESITDSKLCSWQEALKTYLNVL